MNQFVEITFDCLPLRTVTRRDIPLDASPKYRALCERILLALDTHGAFNTYFLYHATCTFHLTTDAQIGMLQFSLEGTVMTDSSDMKTERTALAVTLQRETCDWLTEPIVTWFQTTVSRAVQVEFDRYIAAGDLQQALARLEKIQHASDTQDGFLGMGL